MKRITRTELTVRDAATCRCSNLFSFCCIHQSYSSPWIRQERTASLMRPESQRQLSWPSGCLRICTVQGGGISRRPSAQLPLPLLPRQLRSNPSFDPSIGGPGIAKEHRALTVREQVPDISLLAITPSRPWLSPCNMLRSCQMMVFETCLYRPGSINLMSEVRHFVPMPRAHDIWTVLFGLISAESCRRAVATLPATAFRTGCKHSKPLGLILQGPTYHGERLVARRSSESRQAYQRRLSQYVRHWRGR